MFQPSDPTRIGCNTATKLAVHSRPYVDWKLCAAFQQILFDVKDLCSCLCTNHSLVFVEKQNLAHEPHIDDYLIVNGDRAADEACAPALRDNCQLPLIAML